MSDVERVGAAMREADAKLQVQPPDVSETVGHARRSLIRRLLIVGVLGALGAILLIVGGSAPAFKQLSNAHGTNKGQKTGKGGNGGGKNGHGGGGKGGDKGGGGKGGGSGGHPKHHERFVAAVGPGVPIEVPLPDLVVTHLTKTEVTVANQSPADAEPFEVEVTVQPEEKGQEPLIIPLEFQEGLEGESEAIKTFVLKCASGTIVAEVDPENEIKESSEEDNLSPESPPVKCEPTKDEEEGNAEKAKTRETPGSGSATGTVDTATGASGGATAP